MIKRTLNNEKALPAATVKAQVEKSTIRKEVSMDNHTTKSQKTQTHSEFSTFKFDESEIRTLAINGEPWFIAKDICDVLGLSNSRMSLLVLDDDEKGVSLTYTPSGQQEMNIISESGMYTLILRCRDAVKKGSVPHRFRKWVTAEVLPQIRKTGQYSQNTQQNLSLAEPKPDIVLSYDDAYWIAKYLIRARAFGKEVETFQRQLFETIGLPRYAGRNDLAAKGYDLANEFNHKLDPFIEQVFPQVANVKRIAIY